MKKYFTLITIFFLLFMGFAPYGKYKSLLAGGGEDAIYLSNGNSLKGKIVKATDTQISFNVTMGGDRTILRSFNRENINVAFNSNGNYLVVSNLSTDPVAAQKQIDEFNNSPQRESGYDLLVKAAPMKVIPCLISYESEAVVNYQIPTGGAGSINKTDLVIILYKDGRHQFVMNPAETGDLLKNAVAEVANYSKKSNTPPPPPVQQQPVPQPQQQTPPPAPVPQAPPQTAPAPAPVYSTAQPSITEQERQEYKAKAINKVEEFGNYLSIITDKSLESSDRDKAIEEAAKLFLPEAMIEVSSANRAGTRKYKVREYLTRVKLLPYSSAKVEWSEMQYVNDLHQEADGNYYGTITGQQTFMGFGSKNGEDVIYSDKVKKNVKVKLQAYQKTINGQDAVNWQLYLGNIGVASK
jgi:hypothetical protein